MKNTKFLILLNAFVFFLALSLVFIVLFSVVACSKRGEDNTPKIERVENLISDIEREAIEIEDAPECEEIYDNEGAIKITLFGWKADTSSAACLDKATYKYINHTVARNGNQLSVDFTNGLPSDSITGVTCDYMTFTEQADERERTHRTLYMQNVELPQYKPRTVKFNIAFSNGKTIGKSLKMIPALSNFHGYQFGQSAYFVNLWAFQNKKLTNINTALNENRFAITSNWTPTLGDILCYGSGNNSHYSIISSTPVQKNTKVNNVYRDVFVFKVKEQNAFCNAKMTTKKVIWYDGIGVSSTNIKRDSAYFFRQLSFP